MLFGPHCLDLPLWLMIAAQDKLSLAPWGCDPLTTTTAGVLTLSPAGKPLTTDTKTHLNKAPKKAQVVWGESHWMRCTTVPSRRMFCDDVTCRRHHHGHSRSISVTRRKTCAGAQRTTLSVRTRPGNSPEPNPLGLFVCALGWRWGQLRSLPFTFRFLCRLD